MVRTSDGGGGGGREGPTGARALFLRRLRRWHERNGWRGRRARSHACCGVDGTWRVLHGSRCSASRGCLPYIGEGRRFYRGGGRDGDRVGGAGARGMGRGLSGGAWRLGHGAPLRGEREWRASAPLLGRSRGRRMGRPECTPRQVAGMMNPVPTLPSRPVCPCVATSVSVSRVCSNDLA